MQQRSIPMIAPTTWMIALSLLVAVVLVMSLVVAQLATHPAPDPPGPKPPLQFGPSAGRPMPY